MSEVFDRGLEARILVRRGADWSILEELAAMLDAGEKGEDRLGVILRPHQELAFVHSDDLPAIQQRARLDNALNALTFLEIGCETGQVQQEVLRELVPESFRRLIASEAFFHYVDVYLYFGVRLLAGRLYPPEWWLPGTAKDVAPRVNNQRSFPLAVPPELKGAMMDSPFSRYLEQVDRHDRAPGLGFLDGFSGNAAGRPEQSFGGHSSAGPADFENEGESSRPESQQITFADFELWLRGLLPLDEGPAKQRYTDIAASLIQFARSRADFYKTLQPDEAVFRDAPRSGGRKPIPRGWAATNPVIARLALGDLYYLARLLRAEISTDGRVTYTKSSWMHVLRFYLILHGHMDDADMLVEAEDVLRSVFGFACDLVQNATELTDEREYRFFRPEDYTTPPESTRQWREVFDEELKEVKRQRAIRTYAMVPPVERCGPPRSPGQQIEDFSLGWSEALVSAEQPPHRIGLAFSGGGIRSATFNLGVLQGLQQFDVLRQVDYLSTVSGGGFIGSWLTGNVFRTKNWLAIDTAWDESVRHLRAYSNYLAPLKGILSADSWTMAMSWLRNTFLVQLTGVAWLLALLLTAFLSMRLFLAIVASAPGSLHQAFTPAGLHSRIGIACIVLAVMGIVITLALLYNFTGDRTTTGKNAQDTKFVRWLIVLPACVSAYIVAALLWFVSVSGKVKGGVHYGVILAERWKQFPLLLGFMLLGLIVIGCATMVPTKPWNWVKTLRGLSVAVLVGLFSIGVFYLEMCGILYFFLNYWAKDILRFDVYAFVFGPMLVLLAFTVMIVLQIGLSARFNREAQREWWTRLGAWVLTYAIGGMAWSGFAVLGPRLLIKLQLWACHHDHKWAVPAAVTTWVGTTMSGLFAGHSSKTAGDGDTNKSPALEMLARAGGLLFIAGSVLLGALVLYEFLTNFPVSGTISRDYWWSLRQIDKRALFLSLGVLVAAGMLFAWLFEINIFGLNQFYRNRLVRCYLGATRWTPGIRKPQPFTGFDFNDDVTLSDLQGFRGPFPILNCALNLGGSADLALNTRHSASFTLTPLRCGNDRPKVGYAPTGTTLEDGQKRCFAGGVKLGQAVSISGAAASPNMGYNTSPLVAFLLTMFNVRLGWWFPNPGQRSWYRKGLNLSLYYLTRELLGIADETRNFLNVSDGGHFENLGVYELVRRRCKVIIASDAECDEVLHFGGLGNLVRICETDFGAVIDLDVKSIRQQKDGASLAHCAVGTIKYSNGDLGYLIYLKASISGDEDVSVAQYRSAHPSFPHESTANQFFTEDQFESYRMLGLHVVQHSLRGTRPGEHPLEIAQRLYDVLVPSGCDAGAFLKHTKALDRIWDACRKSPLLHPFIDELMGIRPAVAQTVVQPKHWPALEQRHQLSEELCMGLELLQLMEDVFTDLRLDDFWEHPDNRGWAILFMRWARSTRFRQVWDQAKRTYGIRFEYFCSSRLGLTRDSPIARV